ncbi:thrombospondin type-1 domain-containing protein 7B-like [Anneissia japonica]|uniref:thrombospondin type-1 domain-containing protein 7B-like n=1 Tax=Anneissia japonica TaxID=1529436 RepID=UPI0014255E03|nr:thrombospondin type-1 domain-containing protein 7B-like [Anneissia japonica]
MCAEPTSEERPCNRVCHNGGSLTQNGCNCQNVNYSGPCCECEDIDCQLSHWTKWSSCENATSRIRSRDVLRGSECEGAKCKGPYTEEQACSVVLKGNILVAKWIIITLSIYAGILTLTIFTVCILKRRSQIRNWSINQAANYANLRDDTNESISMARSRYRSRNRRDSIHSTSTIMG